MLIRWALTAGIFAACAAVLGYEGLARGAAGVALALFCVALLVLVFALFLAARDLRRVVWAVPRSPRGGEQVHARRQRADGHSLFQPRRSDDAQ